MINLNTPFTPKFVGILLALFLSIVLAAIVAAYFLMSKPAPEKKSTPAPVAEEVKDAPKEAIQPEKVVVYTATAKKKLGLSKTVIDAPEKHVIEAVEVPASEHDTTAIVVLDSTTGETTTEYQEQPLPWFKVESKHEVRIDYIVKRSLAHCPSISYRYEFTKIKAVSVSCFGSLDLDMELRAGCGLGVNF
jgi:hypothetical protein